MTIMWRVAVLVTALAVMTEGRRLLLGDNGFARVDGGASTATPSGITVSSWVNITEFPGGVAPLVTIISADATYQIAFFVRHDGAGVLWGGPATAPIVEDERVDRHPRSRFHPIRKRRDAVDYSMGLGDVMNIMGPRKERSNTWTPMNFVDVSEMGVADLDTSGSSTNNHYENWYDVGYELQMQESANPEPKIFTKPSGENDFVVINWEGNNAPPLSTNQWDPVNEDLATPDFTSSQVVTKIRAPNNEKFVWSQEESNSDGGWSSQVFPASDSQAPETRFNKNNPETYKPKERKPMRTRLIVPDLTRVKSDKTRRPFNDNFRYNQRQSTTTTTTTKRPLLIGNEAAAPSKERVPLWARLKKTSSETEVREGSVQETTPTPRVYSTTRSPIRVTQKTLRRPVTTPVPFITTRLPVISTRRPVVISRQTVPGTTSTKPPVTKQKLSQRLRTATLNKERKPKPIMPKLPFTPSNRKYKPLQSHSFDEFKRVLEGKPKVEDNGIKVVVYSMPITDVDAFNRMYEHYQEMESRHNPRINLRAVYEQAREGVEIPIINEDESNQNRIEQIPDPLPVLTYKEEPLHFAKSASEQIEEIIPVVIETLIEEPIVVNDRSSFRPMEIAEQYETLERDYSRYYPYVQKADPIIISAASSEQMIQSTDGHLSLNIPMLAAAVEAGELPVIDNIPLVYEPAIMAEQDISGQQAEFYQEPSRISHEQLPPEYTRKPQIGNKIPLPSKQSNEINNRNFRPQVNIRPVIARPQISEPIVEESYASPEIIRQQLLAQALSQSLNTVRRNNEQLQKSKEQYASTVEAARFENLPVRDEDYPIDAENTPQIVKEVPLNVNFRKMPYNFDLNTWYHITFTWSSTDHILKIYVNGQLAGVLEDTIPDMKTVPTSGMMLLGKTLLPNLTGFDPTSHLSGEMSNFVVWGEALTANEVNDVFTCGPSPTHPVLLAWNTTPLRVYNDAAVQQAPPICGISS